MNVLVATLVLVSPPVQSVESTDSFDQYEPEHADRSSLASPSPAEVLPEDQSDARPEVEAQPELVPEGPTPLPDASALLGPPAGTELERWADVTEPDQLRLELDPDPPFTRPPNWAFGWQRESWSLTLRPLDTSTTTPDGRRVFNATHETLGELPFIRPLALPALPNAGDQAWSGFSPAGAGAAVAFEWPLGNKALSPRMGIFASMQVLGNGLHRADGRSDTVAAAVEGAESGWRRSGGTAAVIGLFIRF